MREAYRLGYYAKSKSENPYCKVTQSKKYHAWLAGFNDCDMGYSLELNVFNRR